jgi:hypothetical protein
MSDSITPVTMQRTTLTGVLASSAVGKGRIESKTLTETVYPNGITVTRIHYQTIEIYDNRAVVTAHNVPPKLDIIA